MSNRIRESILRGEEQLASGEALPSLDDVQGCCSSQTADVAFCYCHAHWHPHRRGPSCKPSNAGARGSVHGVETL